MRARLLLCAAMLVVLCSTVAVGQQQAGDFELGLQGFVLTMVGTDYSATIGTIQGKVGIFFTDHLEFGVTPSLTIMSAGGETEVDGGSGAFFTYSFLLKNARTVPYFGAQYYKQSFKTDFEIDPGSIGVTAGAKIFITRKAAFDINANYLFSLADNAEGGILMFAFGFSFLI